MTLVLSATLAAAAAATPVPVSEPLVATFVQACVDGQIAKESVQELQFSQLPRGLRNFADPWKGGRYFRVATNPEAFLFLLPDGGELTPGLADLCAIVTPRLAMQAAFEEVLKRLGSPVPPKPEGFTLSYEQENIDRGYSFFVGGFNTQGGWGGPFASPYRMMRMARMKPEYIAILKAIQQGDSSIKTRRKY